MVEIGCEGGLGVGYARQDRLGVVCAVGTGVAQELFDQRSLVPLVEYRERPTQRLPFAAEDHEAKRVKRRDN